MNVEEKCDSIFVPNAFSPNLDGHNDVLCVRGPGSQGGGPCVASPCVKTIDFTIYNRWGQKVFHTEDITVGWDGAVKNKDADDAVFYYILNVTLLNDKFLYKQGNITLVK